MQEIPLWPDGHEANQGDEPAFVGSDEWMERVTRLPALTPFLPEPGRGSGAAVIICPGGGYGGLAMAKEGLEVAQWMRERGVAGIVLRYRCGGGKNQQPVPLSDAQRAIRMVRSRAAEWNIDAERVGILGFSAGGHLASSAATMFDHGDSAAENPIDRHGSRPDFAVLIYPVISMQEGVTHAGSRLNLLGESPSAELIDAWSTDRRVSQRTPPTFLVHASDDEAVPVKNSLLFYEALVAHGVPAELHVYETGGHGFGMLRGNRPAARWPEQLEPWLRHVAQAEDAEPGADARASASTDNQRTVERYLAAYAAGDHDAVLACLTDDVEWTVPGAFHVTGKQAFDEQIENDAFVGHPEIRTTRLTEQNNVVVAEGEVCTERKDGGILELRFCDVFEMRDGKIQRLTSYLMEVK